MSASRSLLPWRLRQPVLDSRRLRLLRLKVIASVEAETAASHRRDMRPRRLKVIASVEAETGHLSDQCAGVAAASRSLLPWRLRRKRNRDPGRRKDSASRSLLPWRLRQKYRLRSARTSGTASRSLLPWRLRRTTRARNSAAFSRRLKVIASVEAET